MLDFPSSPTLNQKYPASPIAGVPVWRWDGEKWTTVGAAIGKTPVFTDGSQAMTAQLTLITPPVANTDAASKSYVDGGVAGAIAAANSANTNASNKVAKTGDTMTGGLTISGAGIAAASAGISGDITAYRAGSPTTGYVFLGNGGRYIAFDGNYMVTYAPFYCGSSLNVVGQANFGGGTWVQGDGNIIMSQIDYPAKVSGGPWITYSDSRIKNVLGPYTAGLAEIMALKPVNYTLKGNSSLSAPPALKEGEAAPTAPYPNAFGYPSAVEGKISIGLVAQEAETVMPEMVMRVTGWIDGEQVDDLRMYNGNALTYALVNAVKELTARIEVLEAA